MLSVIDPNDSKLSIDQRIPYSRTYLDPFNFTKVIKLITNAIAVESQAV
jgi:hypothetical protein